MGKRGPGLARTQHLVQNLARELQLQGSTVASTKSKVIEVTGTRELLASESGATVYWEKGTAHNITLPTAEQGLYFNVVIKKAETLTAAHPHKIIAAAGDCFFGQVMVMQNDDKTAQQTVTYATATGTPGDYDHILLSSSATDTGSGAGAKIELECIEALVWRVNATLSSSGTPSSIATIYAG